MTDATSSGMGEVVLVARQLGFRWGAVAVDLELHRGRITGFLGRNGAGKSTTMKLLAGVIVPSRGSVSVRVDGVDLAASTSQARAQVGWAPEEPAVHPALTVREQLRFAAELRGVRGLAAKNAVNAVMLALDLVAVADATCGTLSKGTRQRVGVAMALLGTPQILLLDEPTAGLDPAQVEALRALLLEKKRAGAAILLSSHIIAEVEAIADDVVAIVDGVTRHHGDRSTLATAVALVSGLALTEKPAAGVAP